MHGMRSSGSPGLGILVTDREDDYSAVAKPRVCDGKEWTMFRSRSALVATAVALLSALVSAATALADSTGGPFPK